jgi:hypothetical protein
MVKMSETLLYYMEEYSPEWCRNYTTLKQCDVGFFYLHAARLANISICPDTHLSSYEMYHEETPA